MFFSTHSANLRNIYKLCNPIFISFARDFKYFSKRLNIWMNLIFRILVLNFIFAEQLSWIIIFAKVSRNLITDATYMFACLFICTISFHSVLFFYFSSICCWPIEQYFKKAAHSFSAWCNYRVHKNRTENGTVQFQ